MIAGIAIILMFIHHFFGFDEYRFYGNGFYEPVKIGGISIERMLAAFGKLCVAIFAFNSGGAIWKKRNNYISPKALLVRASKFLLNYWIVMFLFMAYAIIAKEPAPDMRSLYCNLLGLNTGPEYEYVNVAFAWYVFFYIVLLAISPLLITIFNQTNRKVDILMFMAFSFIPELISNPLWNTIASTLPAAIAGILTAKWNLFSLAGNILRNCHSLLLCISLAIVAITRQTLILFNLTWGGERRRLCLAHNTFTCRANLKTKSFLDKKVSCIFRILQHEPLVSSQHILHRKPTSTKHSLLASTVCCDIGLGTYVSTACRYTMQQCSTSSVDNIEGSGKTA